MASHHTDSHGLFLLSRRYLFVTKIFLCHEDISFVTRRITESLSIPNYRIIELFFTRRIADVTESLSIPNLRICELFFTRMVTESHGGFLWHETFTLDLLTNGNCELTLTRMVTENLSIPNLRIILHTENRGRSRRIYLSRICELFFTRMVTESHGGFLWHETFTLNILINGKEFAN